MLTLAVFAALFLLGTLAFSLAFVTTMLAGGTAVFAWRLLCFLAAFLHRVSLGRLRRPFRPSAPAAGGPFFMPESGCTTLYQKRGQGGTWQ